MSTALMAPRKNNKRNKAGMAIAKAIIDEYQPKNAEEMQDALKEIFGPMFEAMLQGEMDSHLGYESNDHGPKNTDNRRNGYISKTVKSVYGDIPVEVPRDRDASFEPQAIPKRTRDVSGMEEKVLSMYAKGMSQRDIADTIADIYGFEISHDTISNITDRVIETANEWQNRPLKKFYTFLFVDCLYVSIRKEMETKSYAVYVILGYDVNGIKDILGIWIGESDVVLQNKVPISCAKTANYNRIFINLSLTVCQKNGTLFFLCVSGDCRFGVSHQAGCPSKSPCWCQGSR